MKLIFYVKLICAFFVIVGADDYQIMPNIDISVAVATPNGLITPIVKDVVSKSLPDISNNVKDLALRARDGKLQLQEFQVLYIIKHIPMILMKKFFYVKLFLFSREELSQYQILVCLESKNSLP